MLIVCIILQPIYCNLWKIIMIFIKCIFSIKYFKIVFQLIIYCNHLRWLTLINVDYFVSETIRFVYANMVKSFVSLSWSLIQT